VPAGVPFHDAPPAIPPLDPAHRERRVSDRRRLQPKVWLEQSLSLRLATPPRSASGSYEEVSSETLLSIDLTVDSRISVVASNNFRVNPVMTPGEKGTSTDSAVGCTNFESSLFAIP
jgi:hypothetical protein